MAASTGSSTHSDDDAQSESSSIVYDHEPFVTFCDRVVELTTTTIWPSLGSDEVKVERLQGGGFNRIVGISRLDPEGSSDSTASYILRIPRFDSNQIGNEVAVLHFLLEYTAIPAPRVIAFDEEAQNALDSPYALQERLPGTDLYSSYPDLSHEDRCRVARELGRIFNQMLEVRSHAAGRLTLSDSESSAAPTLLVAPWMPADRKLAKPYSNSTPQESPCQLLKTVFLARKAEDVAQSPSDVVGPKLWDQFCQMTSELEACGRLDMHNYSIAHLDFAPRNILVDSTTSAEASIISGVLDWDSAVFAPPFMSCAPPMWLWNWQDDEDEDERKANEQPPTSQGQQLKQLLESAAGNEYRELAYKPAYRLARRLVQFAIDGLRSNEDFQEAKAMLKEWSETMGRERGGLS